MTKSQEERLYFIVRSYIMGCISGIIFPAIVFVLGKINWIETIIIGTFVYIISLVISRVFDNQINIVTEKVLKYLNKYKKIKNFILKYF
jgi:ABC-type transport system involved in cytochrome bd biosynthesis fused ATPase/permease subunit